jgi:hypothetical protein
MLIAGAALLLLAAAASLPPVYDAADNLFQKSRYTSICTGCGEQATEIFYLILGTEVLRIDQVLPINSANTALPKQRGTCEHQADCVTIGKTMFVVTKRFEVSRLDIGTPYGWDFEGVDLTATLSELSAMKPGAALGVMQSLRERRIRPENAGENR